MENMTSNRFVLSIVKDRHLHIRYNHSLVYNYKRFIIKAAVAHHPVIKEEIDELLTKDTIWPSNVGAGLKL